MAKKVRRFKKKPDPNVKKVERKDGAILVLTSWHKKVLSIWHVLKGE